MARKMDWQTIVALAEGGRNDPDTEYLFSNGRKFVARHQADPPTEEAPENLYAPTDPEQ